MAKEGCAERGVCSPDATTTVSGTNNISTQQKNNSWPKLAYMDTSKGGSFTSFTLAAVLHTCSIGCN